MPGECSACTYEFADPMEAQAAYYSLFGRGPWFKIRRAAERFFAGHNVRIMLLGTALGTALGEIGRRLWDL